MMRSFIAVAVAFIASAGCVEIQQMLAPSADPDARYNLALDSDDGDDADDGDSTDDGDDESTLDDLVREINAGNVGSIPAISEDIEQVMTETGLRYFDVIPGIGESPLPDSTVNVSYTGWLAEDGTEFDANQDAQFNLQSVIDGWTEGLSSMQINGIRRLIIPPELGYGERGSPPDIPPDATLVFDVELLNVE
ncbi:MAG: FKBP-type peptidyl-prolyl cis-trans isomerase [Phycisphaerales bacterium]|nr:MAG: FKBP-type peptidyl-prolyl cis-trans isomerase [Phycisphaerales bacterium]